MKDFYVRLYKATARACQSEMDPNSFPPYAWRSLTKVWKVLIDKEWHPFYVVLYKLFWGVYPYEYIPRKFQPLLDVVKQILISGNAIARAWCHTEAFEWAMDKVMDGRYGEDDFNSIEHMLYLETRLKYEILHLREGIENYNHITKTQENYRGTVCMLIPQARKWGGKTWGKVSNILKGLDDKYGTAYESNGDEYDDLIYMLKDFIPETVTWSMSYIRVFSLELAKKIWPEDTEATLDGLFMNVVEKTKKYVEDGRLLDGMGATRYPKGVFDFNKLRSSWLFQYVGSRIGNNVYPDNHPVKRAYFDVVFSS